MLGHVTIYGNLSGSNIKQIRFVSFGPDKTHNFIGSPHPGIFRLFGIREGCLYKGAMVIENFRKEIICLVKNII